MKIKIYPVVSSLHESKRINHETEVLIDELIKKSEHQISLCDIDGLYDSDLALILIQSGGSEQLFLENYSKLKPPFYLLTYGYNNSLAASLEILSYLKDNNLDGEVLHGDTDYLIERINQLGKGEKCFRYGVIGKPSDWLIASQVNYQLAAKIHQIDLFDIAIEELIDVYNNIEVVEEYSEDGFKFDKIELASAFKLKQAINILKEKYQLNGLTIRCFDLLNTIKTTACLALAIFNQNGIVSTCEGDIPTMISMHVLKNVCGQVGFQANPSSTNVKDSKMVLAHCTLPLDMPKTYSLDTHFESGIGVAIKGELKEEVITIFKLSRNLKDYYVTTGRIIRNLYEDNLCRTQIEVKVDNNIEYFLNRPYGNHHVIIYGDYLKEIQEYMRKVTYGE